MRKPAWLLAAAALIAAAAAAILLVGPRALGIDEVKPLPRARNGVGYVLYVHVPVACRHAQPCPALYVLDAVPSAPGLVRIATDSERHSATTPVVIVGIGYQDAAATPARRKFDFTPGARGAKTGGADAFLDVLRDEIIPYAEAHYPIDPRRRGLIAHSYAGLFAVHALRRAPDLFERELIVSPALWFDNYAVFNEPTHTARRAHVIVLASDTPGETDSAMARDVRRLGAALQTEPELRVFVRVYPHTTHAGVVEPAFRAALPTLYPAHEN